MSIRTVACEKFIRALAKKHDLVAVRCNAAESGSGVIISIGLWPRGKTEQQKLVINANGVMSFTPFHPKTVPFWKEFLGLPGKKDILGGHGRVTEQKLVDRKSVV